MEGVDLRKLQCLVAMKVYGEIHFVRDMVLDLFNYNISGCDFILQGRMTVWLVNNVELQAITRRSWRNLRHLWHFQWRSVRLCGWGHLNQGRSAGCNFKLGHPTCKIESLPYRTRRDRRVWCISCYHARYMTCSSFLMQRPTYVSCYHACYMTCSSF
jgi:hypothetical protein